MDIKIEWVSGTVKVTAPSRKLFMRLARVLDEKCQRVDSADPVITVHYINDSQNFSEVCQFITDAMKGLEFNG